MIVTRLAFRISVAIVAAVRIRRNVQSCSVDVGRRTGCGMQPRHMIRYCGRRSTTVYTANQNDHGLLLTIALPNHSNVRKGDSIINSCAVDWHLADGHNNVPNTCRRRRWTLPVPQCKRRCSARPMRHSIVLARCTFDNKNVQCLDSGHHRTGTTAQFEFSRPPDTAASNMSSTYVTNGTWIGAPPYKVETIADPGCVLQLTPHLRAFYADDLNTELANGTVIGNLMSVWLDCADDWYLNTTNDENLCVNTEWGDEAIGCERRCNALPHNPSTTLMLCSFQGIGTLCNAETLRPGTVANFGCRAGYTADFDSNVAKCDENGQWIVANSIQTLPMRCVAICGLTSASTGMPFMSANIDTKINNTDVPWHVAVYSDAEGGSFEHICGGTIVSNRLVVSAAHCCWNIPGQRFHETHHFRVATGRYYRDYDAVESLPGQKLGVKLFLSPWSRRRDNHEADIVVLVLAETIELHDYIVPICVYPNAWSMLDNEPRGLVAGWGGAADRLYSPVLQSITVPMVTGQKCKESMQLDFAPFITPDSFCGGYMNQNISLCPGDSGGGIVAQRDNSSNPENMFLGVVRLGSYTTSGKCDIYKYTLFTNVSYYSGWIRELMDEYDEEGIIPAGYITENTLDNSIIST